MCSALNFSPRSSRKQSVSLRSCHDSKLEAESGLNRPKPTDETPASLVVFTDSNFSLLSGLEKSYNARGTPKRLAPRLEMCHKIPFSSLLIRFRALNGI